MKAGFAVSMFLTIVLVTLSCAPRPDESISTTPTEVWIFAAASLRDVIQELGAEFAEENNVQPVYNFAGSNDLAQQIAASPKAHVFLSASNEWMDYVQERGLVTEGTRSALLSNQLVVIAHSDSTTEVVTPEKLCELAFEHLSLADPAAVPAGIYAKEWLEGLKCGEQTIWDVVKDRVAPAIDPRAAMAVVESDVNTIGIVYKTDAAASQGVKVLYEVDGGPKIEYAAALIGETPPAEARALLDFLKTDTARAVWERHGFVALF